MRRNKFQANSDILNNPNVNWCGHQANYFTDDLAFSHSIYPFPGDLNDNGAPHNFSADPSQTYYTIFYTKCVIGNEFLCKQFP